MKPAQCPNICPHSFWQNSEETNLETRLQCWNNVQITPCEHQAWHQRIHPLFLLKYRKIVYNTKWLWQCGGVHLFLLLNWNPWFWHKVKMMQLLIFFRYLLRYILFDITLYYVKKSTTIQKPVLSVSQCIYLHLSFWVIFVSPWESDSLNIIYTRNVVPLIRVVN